MPGWAWGWDAVGAVATSCATIVALGAMPWTEWRARAAVARERSEASVEIVAASRSVVLLHHEMGKLLEQKGWDEDAMSSIRVRSRQLEIALHRLITKSGLTAEIIIVAAGSRAIAIGIADTPTLAEAVRHAQMRPRSQDRRTEVLERVVGGLALNVSVKPDAQRIYDANSVIVGDVERRIAENAIID